MLSRTTRRAQPFPRTGCTLEVRGDLTAICGQRRRNAGSAGPIQLAQRSYMGDTVTRWIHFTTRLRSLARSPRAHLTQHNLPPRLRPTVSRSGPPVPCFRVANYIGRRRERARRVGSH